MGRLIDGDELVLWLTKWMMSSFGAEPTEETEAIRKVCDAVGDMVKDLAKDTGGDLISRAAAIDVVNRPICPTGDATYDNAREFERESIREELEQLPSADRRGQWKEVGTFTDDKGITTHVLNCLECGALHRVRKLWTGEYVNANFCPNCGADMRGEIE